jgi:hypothetical protein
MGGIREEVTGGVADAINPAVDHLINALARNLGISQDNPLLSQLSGKTIEIDVGKITIKIPDLPKKT